MNEGKITSLCVTFLNSHEQLRLFRLADLREGRLAPYTEDASRERTGDNRTHLMPGRSRLHQAGKVAMWEWDPWSDAPDVKITKRRVIEVVRLEGVSSLPQLKSQLIEGVDALSVDRDFLFEYDSGNGTALCMFCGGGQLSAGRDGKASLKENEYFLDKFEIRLSDVCDLATWRIDGFSLRCYMPASLPPSLGLEPIYAPETIAKRAFLARVKDFPHGSKSDKTKIRGFLEHIPENAVYEEVTRNCGCGEDEAMARVDAFHLNCLEFLEGTDWATSTLENLIERETPLSGRFRTMVERDWQKENEKLVKQAEAELLKIHNQVVGVQKKLEERRECAERLRLEVEELRTEHKRLLDAADDIAARVERRLADARGGVAAFFAEHAVFAGAQAPASAQPLARVSAIEIQPGTSIEEEPMPLETAESFMDALAYNLEVAGVSKERCLPLAGYLAAAHAAKAPLLLAGFGGERLADALSATLHNRTASRVYCFGRTDASPLKRCGEGEVVCVYDAFRSGATSGLFSLNAPAFLCFIALTEEELAMEPQGLFSYALPLFVELLMEKPNGDAFEGYACVELPPRVKTNDGRISGLVPKNAVSRVVYERCKGLISHARGFMAEIGKEVSALDVMILQTLPLLQATGRREELQNLLDSAKISSDERGKLLEMLGGELSL